MPKGRVGGQDINTEICFTQFGYLPLYILYEL